MANFVVATYTHTQSHEHKKKPKKIEQNSQPKAHGKLAQKKKNRNDRKKTFSNSENCAAAGIAKSKEKKIFFGAFKTAFIIT